MAEELFAGVQERNRLLGGAVGVITELQVRRGGCTQQRAATGRQLAPP